MKRPSLIPMVVLALAGCAYGALNRSPGFASLADSTQLAAHLSMDSSADPFDTSSLWRADLGIQQSRDKGACLVSLEVLAFRSAHSSGRPLALSVEVASIYAGAWIRAMDSVVILAPARRVSLAVLRQRPTGRGWSGVTLLTAEEAGALDRDSALGRVFGADDRCDFLWSGGDAFTFSLLRSRADRRRFDGKVTESR